MSIASYDTSLTETEYSGFQRAYEHFNRALFGNSLPAVLITLQRHANAKGFFSPNSFTARGGTLMKVLGEGNHAHEVALNPDTFHGRTDEEILSTLAHEMAHVWQEVHGKAPRRCYHDKQWAAKMIEIGLMPTSTGEPGGKQTGQSVTHMIVGGGAFQKAYEAFAAQGYALNWQATPFGEAEKKKKTASKTKYTCSSCGANAWAKPGANLICGDCAETDEELPRMIAENEEPEP